MCPVPATAAYINRPKTEALQTSTTVISLNPNDLKTLNKIVGFPENGLAENAENKHRIRNIPAAYNFLREKARADGEVLFWLGRVLN